MKFAGKKSQDLKSLQQKIREMNNLVQIRGKQIRILGKDSQTLSAIFNHTEVGFLIIGHELKIKWNNNIVKIWVEKEGIDDITNIGYKELLNSFGQILPDPGPVEQVFETCGVVNYNFRMGSGINKTNIYMTAMPIQSPDGKVIEVLVMLRDLTDFETLHNSQQELEQSEKLTKTLFRISNAVNTTDNLDDLFESIHEVLANIIDVTNFAIGIYDSNKDIISYPYYVDETNDVYHAIKDVSTSGILAAEVINLKKPLFLSKSDIIKRKKKAGRKSIESNPAQWLGVPLIIKKKAVGVIVVQSYSNPELYSQKDAEILLAVSDQIAFAVDRKRSEEALAKSREQIKNISNQTDQFSLTAASMISANNPKDIFNKISRAIVKFSNYKRVVITYLTDESPYHEILAYDGLKEENIEKYRQVIIRPGFFDNFFKNGTGIGQFSVFIQSFELKKVYNDKLVIKSNKKIPDLPSDSWRLDDMLFVRMQDVSGNLIGFISVDDPKSMRRPTDETVRPLEIFSSLVSQIIINTKSQEELKIAKDAAEASAKSKSKFLANMSHEIRTPMNAIMGLTELTLKTDLDLRQKDYLNKIKSSSTSLIGIINDILDFSKIDAGKMDIEEIDFRLGDVMDGLSDMFSNKTAEKNIEFVISIANDIPLNLIGDPLRLRQALINLTGNAVKFTKKGEVIVSVSNIKCEGEYIKLRFSIKDTGIGIPKERLGKLFDSFVQADGSTTRKYGGTGLGLSISKKLIELMGGGINVKSKAGKGTEFSFHITFKKKNEKTIKSINLDTGLKGLKVLVVDDNKTARDIMDETLSSFRFNVETIDSGEKAILNLVKADKAGAPYKLVILDLIMPEIDGIETAKRIRKNYNAFDVPIIMMTGFGREDTMRQAKKAKVNAFLMKPVKQSILLDTIMDIFGKKPDAHISEAIETKDTSTELAELNGLNVLLTEDNNINQLVASRILEEVGVKVSIASTGVEAVQLLEKNKYDIVLMDVQMPEMDGYSATGVIRNKLKLKDLPIIAMTAHAMTGDREKCINSGMDDYISKPIDSNILYSKLIKFKTLKNDSLPVLKDIDNKNEHGEKESSMDLPDSLPDYLPGIDIKSGISRFLGNTELYVELMGGFIKEHKDSANKIQTMIISNNIKEALSYIHSIKGTAGNLSLTRLHDSSARLESFIEKNSKADDILLEIYEKAFCEALNSLKKINDIFKVNKTDYIGKNESEFDQADIENKIKFLHTKLLQNDLEALDAIHVVKNMIQRKIAENEILALDKAINNFDFDEAKTVLLKISDTLKITLEGM